jgi:hypothetical protein
MLALIINDRFAGIFRSVEVVNDILEKRYDIYITWEDQTPLDRPMGIIQREVARGMDGALSDNIELLTLAPDRLII